MVCSVAEVPKSTANFKTFLNEVLISTVSGVSEKMVEKKKNLKANCEGTVLRSKDTGRSVGGLMSHHPMMSFLNLPTPLIYPEDRTWNEYSLINPNLPQLQVEWKCM